jgi:hypothetical protein
LCNKEYRLIFVPFNLCTSFGFAIFEWKLFPKTILSLSSIIKKEKRYKINPKQLKVKFGIKG